jgi:hypothetical protein
VGGLTLIAWNCHMFVYVGRIPSIEQSNNPRRGVLERHFLTLSCDAITPSF